MPLNSQILGSNVNQKLSGPGVRIWSQNVGELKPSDLIKIYAYASDRIVPCNCLINLLTLLFIRICIIYNRPICEKMVSVSLPAGLWIRMRMDPRSFSLLDPYPDSGGYICQLKTEGKQENCK